MIFVLPPLDPTTGAPLVPTPPSPPASLGPFAARLDRVADIMADAAPDWALGTSAVADTVRVVDALNQGCPQQAALCGAMALVEAGLALLVA